MAAPQPTIWERASTAGERLVDGVVLLGMGLFILIDVYVIVLGPFNALRLAGSIGALVAVALRRRYPVPAFAAVLGLIGATFLVQVVVGTSRVYEFPVVAPIAALAVMITPLVRRLPTNDAITAGVAGAIGVLVTLTWPVNAQFRILLTMAFAVIYGVGLGTGIYLRGLERRSVLAAESARRDERLELARELHDLVAHHVTGMVVTAQAAQVVADRDPAAAGTALVRIEGAGREALDAMRRLVGSLREGDGDGGAVAPVAPPVGLAGLEDLTEAVDGTGLTVRLVVDPAARETVSTTVAASAHRIVQESLTNARRHAVDATVADVDVRLYGTDLYVTVTDDGHHPVGGPRPDRPGYGLVGMTERAHALGGDLVAGPAAPPAHGWVVQARLPLDGGGR